MSINNTNLPRIAICETESSGIQHEEVNAAVIDLFIKQYQAKAVLYSATDHWQCINAIHTQRLGTSLPIDHRAIEPPFGKNGETEKYQKLISSLFEQMDSESIEHVLFTNTHAPALYAIINCMDQFPHIKISMIVHGQLDQHLGFSRFKRWRTKPMLIDELMAQSGKRIRFFTVAGQIEDLLASRGLAHIQTASLHHPYLWNANVAQSPNKNSKPKVCCIGSIHSDKGRRQMRGLVSELSKLTEDFELTFFGRFSTLTNDKRITIHNRRFDRAEFDELVPRYDFILQPYTENSYQLKASGVLFDAINYEVPILTTSTLFTQFYFNLLGEIGFLANDSHQLFDKLASCIMNPDENAAAGMKQNLHQAKTRLNQLNQNITL